MGTKSPLQGRALTKANSLIDALDKDNTKLIRQRWRALCGILGTTPASRGLRSLLTDEQAARLARTTSFTV